MLFRSLSKHGLRPAQFSPEVWDRGEFGYRNLPEFLDIIREVTHQGLIDIMLMSAYVNEQLAIKEGLFKNSHVTPAARANDTTDVWAARHGAYTREPSQPFRSAAIDHIQCGEIECDRDGSGEFSGANLGLYSITFVNDWSRTARRCFGTRNFARRRSGSSSGTSWKFLTPTSLPASRRRSWVSSSTTIFSAHSRACLKLAGRCF